MQYAVFFRNLNLGRAHSPTKAQLEQAFLHADVTTLPAVPFASERGDVEILQFTASEALSISRTVGNTPGSPNAFLEKQFGLPATTRNWNTVVRLVQKHA